MEVVTSMCKNGVGLNGNRCDGAGSCFLKVRHYHTTSIKIIKNEVGCRDDTVPKTVDTRRHCEEE